MKKTFAFFCFLLFTLFSCMTGPDWVLVDDHDLTHTTHHEHQEGYESVDDDYGLPKTLGDTYDDEYYLLYGENPPINEPYVHDYFSQQEQDEQAPQDEQQGQDEQETPESQEDLLTVIEIAPVDLSDLDYLYESFGEENLPEYEKYFDTDLDEHDNEQEDDGNESLVNGDISSDTELEDDLQDDGENATDNSFDDEDDIATDYVIYDEDSQQAEDDALQEDAFAQTQEQLQAQTQPVITYTDIDIISPSGGGLPNNNYYEHEPDYDYSENDDVYEYDGISTPVASRKANLDLGAYLDVIYPGSGWIYLGETDSPEKMVFLGRKLGEDMTSFTLRSKESGTTLLHFYKDDLLTGKYIDDWLEVEISEKQAENIFIHAVAPSYAAIVPPKPSRPKEQDTAVPESQPEAPAPVSTPKTETPPVTAQVPEQNADNSGRTVIQTTQSEQPAVSQSPVQAQTPDTAPTTMQSQANDTDNSSLLERAKELYASGKFPEALEAVRRFFETATEKIDEGLYLQGQIYESNSSVKDIKAAIDSYKILLDNWPKSNLWADAQKRYIYLRRFYINIH